MTSPPAVPSVFRYCVTVMSETCRSAPKIFQLNSGGGGGGNFVTGTAPTSAPETIRMAMTRMKASAVRAVMISPFAVRFGGYPCAASRRGAQGEKPLRNGRHSMFRDHWTEARGTQQTCRPSQYRVSKVRLRMNFRGCGDSDPSFEN